MRSIANLMTVACIAFTISLDAKAQDNPLGNLFGSIVKTLNNVAADVEWSNLDEDVRRCVKETFGTSPSRLASQGISPSDSRVARHVKQCERRAASSGLPENLAAWKVVDQARTYSLDVTKACSHKFTWSDAGSGADKDGYFYNPNVPSSYFFVGGTGVRSEDKKHCSLVVRPSSGNPAGTPRLLVAPKDWTMVWEDKGSDANEEGSMWHGVPPSSEYQCIGSIVKLGYNKPHLPKYRCVHKSLLKNLVVSSLLWSDEGSGADQEVTVINLPESRVTVATAGRYGRINALDFNILKAAKSSPRQQLANVPSQQARGASSGPPPGGVTNPSQARMLTNLPPLAAYVPKQGWCGKTITVTVVGPNANSFNVRRRDFQRLAGGVRAITGFECPKARSIELIGRVGRTEAGRFTMARSENWRLKKKSPVQTAGITDPSQARMLANMPPLAAYVPKQGWCGKTVTVTVVGPSANSFNVRRREFQQLAGGVRAITGFECPKARSIELIGQMGRTEVGRFTMARSENWRLKKKGSIRTTSTGQPRNKIRVRRMTAQVQNLLNGLGYNAGPVDGSAGSGTRKAIKQFQRYTGAPETGEVTSQLEMELELVVDLKKNLKKKI